MAAITITICNDSLVIVAVEGGWVANGVVAIGGVVIGGVAIGGVAIGGVAIGGVAIGGIAIGGSSLAGGPSVGASTGGSVRVVSGVSALLRGGQQVGRHILRGEVLVCRGAAPGERSAKGAKRQRGRAPRGAKESTRGHRASGSDDGNELERSDEGWLDDGASAGTPC
jgi:hypothetical protein